MQPVVFVIINGLVRHYLEALESGQYLEPVVGHAEVFHPLGLMVPVVV